MFYRKSQSLHLLLSYIIGYVHMMRPVDYYLISPDQQILWSLPNIQITLLYWKINPFIVNRYFKCWSSIRNIRCDGNSRKMHNEKIIFVRWVKQIIKRLSQNSKTSHCDSGELKFTLTATSGNYILCSVNREI